MLTKKSTPIFITMTTDFGEKDRYVFEMKSRFYRELAERGGDLDRFVLLDVTHYIPRQNVRAAWPVVRNLPSSCPGASFHLVVVDPGVGTDRRGLVVDTGRDLFVAPDNGVLTEVLSRFPQRRAFVIDSFWRKAPAGAGIVFDGRDLFVPALAALATGTPPEKIGPPASDPVLLEVPRAAREGERVFGEVTSVDSFGNLQTNIPAEWISAGAVVELEAGGKSVPYGRAYAEDRNGTGIALPSSEGFLEIAVRGGSAAEKFGIAPGHRVTVKNVR